MVLMLRIGINALPALKCRKVRCLIPYEFPFFFNAIRAPFDLLLIWSGEFLISSEYDTYVKRQVFHLKRGITMLLQFLRFLSCCTSRNGFFVSTRLSCSFNMSMMDDKTLNVIDAANPVLADHHRRVALFPAISLFYGLRVPLSSVSVSSAVSVRDCRACRSNPFLTWFQFLL